MINKRLVNRCLSIPTREAVFVVKKMCDYDLLTYANTEGRAFAHKAAIAELKRRGVVNHVPRPKPEPNSGNPLF